VLDSAPSYAASNLYGIRNVPSMFLVERDGAISTSVTGFSRQFFEELGRRFGVTVFEPHEHVPALRPG
jgi:hypothetical protein